MTATTMDYSEQFFKGQQDFAAESARGIVSLLMEWVHPRSVIDLGCALGDWLAAFRENGVDDIIGVDGSYIDLKSLQIPQERFKSHDLSRPYYDERTFDLAICLEVAEHLPSSSALGLIRSLTALSPLVLFSAAVPGQGGINHVNEQWQDYWLALFRNEGYLPADIVRHRIWDNSSVRWWYAQNTILYVREDRLQQYPCLQEEMSRCTSIPVRLVHPRMYMGLRYATDPPNVRLAQGFSFMGRVLKHFVRRRLVRPVDG
jgi:SAM-dependent methyltransferase